MLTGSSSRLLGLTCQQTDQQRQLPADRRLQHITTVNMCWLLAVPHVAVCACIRVHRGCDSTQACCRLLAWWCLKAFKAKKASEHAPAVAAAAVAAVMVVLCDCQMLDSCSQVASDREVD